ncbi:LytR C-terminal domain-containing protein [Streptomyces sp. NPDC092296]|uniref:LytR C-terminal domain-containing protein n=1 Tax=Streptomyces sp. NPDC092296 TaxID=3366012 RepID=UPI0038186DB8
MPEDPPPPGPAAPRGRRPAMWLAGAASCLVLAGPGWGLLHTGHGGGHPGGRVDAPRCGPGPRSQDAVGPAHAVPPRLIRLQVLNGTGDPGLGARVDRELRRDGFATTGLAGAATGPGTARTVVRYDPRWDESVRTVAAALPGALLIPAPGLGPVMQVVAGADYTAPEPLPAAPPPAGAAPRATRCR